MRKEYFVLLGTRAVELEDLIVETERLSPLKFQKRDSHFSGVYYSYSGDSSDAIIIESNFNTAIGEWNKPEFQEYSLLIQISNTRGKNIERELRTTTIKEIFVRTFNAVVLREKTYEE